MIEYRYENLIRIAFNCPRGMKNGAEKQLMLNAISMEEGKTFARHLGSFDKQFDIVKNYTSKALIKLSRTKPYSIEKDFFYGLGNEINLIGTTSQLTNIINIALDKVIELKK